MAELDLTREEWKMVLGLIQGKSVKVGNPVEFTAYQAIEKKLLDYLSGPGLDLGGK